LGICIVIVVLLVKPILIIEFIKANIAWIKDFGMFLFAGIGAVVTILAYRRARTTILQPIRNEVIKKQSEILCDVLHLCQSPIKIDTSLDYLKIVRINVLQHLRELGFIFNNREEFYSDIDKNISGFIYCGDSSQINDFKIISTFNSDKQKSDEAIDLGKKKYEDAKTGIVHVERIYVTKLYFECFEKLQNLLINPFMPSMLQTHLGQLLKDIEDNLCIHLKIELEIFIKDYFKKISHEKEYPNFNIVGVFNAYNHRRIHHNLIIESLNDETRKYLRIDEPWE
jgi:hypothetical protein